MPREDIRVLRRGDIVQMECQIQRYRERRFAKSSPWVTWQTNFNLGAITRIFAAPLAGVPADPESEEETMKREDTDDELREYALHVC